MSVGQMVEDGWKGILVFKSDKAAVEKILGKPQINSDGYYNYSTNEAFVQVDFSARPCTNVPYGRGRYNIPQDRVISYRVDLKKETLLSELKFDRTKYYRDTSGDLLNNVYYISDETGVDIGVGIHPITKIEYVGSIHYGPKKTEREARACKNIDSNRP